MFRNDQLRKIRLEKGLTQAALAEELEINRAAYNQWERGKTQPNAKHLKKLAELMELPPEYFYTVDQISEIYVQLSQPGQVKVVDFARKTLKEEQAHASEAKEEVYEYKVHEKLSAGGGYGYANDYTYDLVYFDKEIDHDFASWIYGDSMEPLYLNGSVALIKDTGFDYDGAIYAVDWDGQSYVKRVYREEAGLRLVSLNNKYSDKFAPYTEEPRIIGKVVGNFIPLVE